MQLREQEISIPTPPSPSPKSEKSTSLKKITGKVGFRVKATYTKTKKSFRSLVKRDNVQHRVAEPSADYAIPSPELGPRNIFGNVLSSSAECLADSNGELRDPFCPGFSSCDALTALFQQSGSPRSPLAPGILNTPLASDETLARPSEVSPSEDGDNQQVYLSKIGEVAVPGAETRSNSSTGLEGTNIEPSGSAYANTSTSATERKQSSSKLGNLSPKSVFSSSNMKRLSRRIEKLSPKAMFASLAAIVNCAGHSDDSDNDASDNEEECDTSITSDSDPPYFRSDWSAVKNIPEEALRALVLAHANTDGTADLESTRVIRHTEGSYHQIFYVRIRQHGSHEDVIVRIPAHGTAAFWCDEDEYRLEDEANLMKYLFNNTSIPVPEVLDFSAILQNPLGFPYILMRCLPGKPAYNIWRNNETYDLKWAFRTADYPSAEIEKRRINFLRSLACTMTELRAIEFDWIGIPHFPAGTHGKARLSVGPSYHWFYPSSPNKITVRPPYKSTREFIMAILSQNWKKQFTAQDFSDQKEILGLRKIFDIIFSLPMFNHSEKESFTLRHNDLDLQNILTDEDGNITGIIDWDGSSSAPRCVGMAAVPLFLRRDWFPESRFGLTAMPHLGWKTQYYRDLYSAFMHIYSNPDAHLTSKSALYQAAIEILDGNNDARELSDKILRKIPNFHHDTWHFRYALGLGWPYAEEELKKELAKIFEPTVPDEEIFEAATACVAAVKPESEVG